MPRFYKSRYLTEPIIYVQEEWQWMSFAPGGVTTVHDGAIPETILNSVGEISSDETEHLLSPRYGETEQSETNRRRIVISALVAVVAFVAPLLLLVFFPSWGGIGALVAAVVGPMVFTLLSRPRPDWAHGLGLAVVPALTAGIWLPVLLDHAPSGSDLSVHNPAALSLIGLLMFMVAFLAGMGGASIASLIARLFERKPWDPAPRKFKAWHMGAATALVDVVAAVAVAAIMA